MAVSLRVTDHSAIAIRVEDFADSVCEISFSEVEKEANLFAAELLIPAAFLEADLVKSGGMDIFDEDVLKGLVGKYRVSAQGLTYRLTYLGYVK